MTSPDNDPLASRHTKSFLAHLEDLRRTILWCLITMALGIVVTIPLVPRIVSILQRPVVAAGMDPAEFLKIIQIAGGFAVAMRVSFWGGLVISAPIMVVVVAHFVFPGLLPRERTAVRRASGFAVALFIVGVVMGYFVTLPMAVKVLLGVNQWLGKTSEFVILSDYMSFALKILLAFGLAFELPVVVLALGSMGLVTSAQLAETRRYVIVFLMVLAMVLTPPDPVTQLLMAAPLALLYEACIWILRARERRAAEPRF